MDLLGWLFILFSAVAFLLYQLLAFFPTATLKPAGTRLAFKNLKGSQSLEKTARKLEDQFVFVSAEKLNSQRQGCIIGGGVLGLMVGFVAGALVGILLMIVFSAVGFFIPQIFLKRTIAGRQKKFQIQVLDFLDTVANALKAGLSFVQALETAAGQLPDPMGQELQLVLREHHLGTNLDEALMAMGERVRVDSFNLVVSAITVTRQLGGNLPQIFSTISGTIRDRDKIEGKIQALTAQGKMQAMIMGLIPFAIMAAIYCIDQKTIMPLFTTPLGLLMLTMVFVLDGIGFFMIKKMVTIEV